jgi:hypothetical protein
MARNKPSEERNIVVVHTIMSKRELILLSPYRVPAKDSLMLNDEDVSAFMNGYLTLWHPAAAWGAEDPPRIASQYDYENPVEGHIYAVPESPQMFLPDDWDERVRHIGAAAFRAGTDRAATLENLKAALTRLEERQRELAAERAQGGGEQPPHSDASSQSAERSKKLYDLPAETVAPFFGLGFGFLHVNALFEAMDHDNLLDMPAIWKNIQDAIEAVLRDDAEACRSHQQQIAEQLTYGRDALYPVTIHVVDVALLDEANPTAPLPSAPQKGQPLNVVASGALLDKLKQAHPERIAELRERIKSDQIEVCGGCYTEREDSLLPIESQLWNVMRGLTASRAALENDVRIYARRRGGAYPQLPQLLTAAGITRAVMVSYDDSSMPGHRATVVTYPSADGRELQAFTRAPYKADSPQTYFHAAYYLHQTIAQDHAATLSLVHRAGTLAPPFYDDWLELSKFGPVLGKWTTLSNYFNEVLSGEQASLSSPDDYHADQLTERTETHVEKPVSDFAERARLRRRIDTVWSLAAVMRGLAGKNDPLRINDRLVDLETRAELGDKVSAEIASAQDEVMGALAGRLLSRATGSDPGFLLVNPCSFARRVALELDGVKSPLPIGGPLKACQLGSGEEKTKVVVELPALGFAWLPQAGPPGTPAQTIKTKLADETHVRNEFFEAEIDPATGGLRGIYDHRTRINRIGQQLVYNPGSVMRVKSVKVTSTGPALGEVISEGGILDEQGQVLATYRQRFRAWLGRPVLELRIEIFPEHEPVGYPWHTYYGARFAWRDERTMLLRGVGGVGYVTNHTRPETPDYLEWRLGRANTVLFPGGLPFHQRHGGRMLDVILEPEGESGRAFELGIGLDREHPMQTALGMVSPVAVLPVSKGPPHIGASGWLFHLDAPNLLLTGLRPGPDGQDAMIARLLECAMHSSPAEFRCVRNPTRACRLDAHGESTQEFTVSGDAALLDVSAGDFMQVKIDFGS